MAEVQATLAWSRGTPGDNQIATCLVDVDHAISTDKQFVELAGHLRSHSPVSLARVHRAPADDALAFVVDILSKLA